MKIVCIGGGPAGLYLAILLKKADPAHQITVIERNARDQTFGWGVVFSDETLGNLLEADPDTHAEIVSSFAHWDDIDVHYGGEVIRTTGHGFSGIARKQLLRILQRRAESLGVELVFEREVDDLAEFAGYDLVVGADGIRSRVRAAHADVFRPSLDPRRCKYIWCGTTKIFDAFTFLFRKTEFGIVQIHAYRYDKEHSTFIAECDEGTWRRAGLDRMSPEEGARWLEQVFAEELEGHPLLLNGSQWINFSTVRNERWRHGNIVLIGDAAHTAHFSIGSGTKLAIEDAILLAESIANHPGEVERALEKYEEERRPMVARIQKAAQDSLDWFENTARHWGKTPLQFTFSLLTRSKRIGWENLHLRDPAFMKRVADELAPKLGTEAETPPMFAPYSLRTMELSNRVCVSPMCMYSARGGMPDDFHLVHYGSLAMGGAGLLFTEMTVVSAEGRISPGCTGLWADEHTEAWRRIVSFVHGHSQAKVCVQLGHAGRKGSTRRMWEGMDEPLPEGNWPLISASPLPWHPHSQTPREATRADMDEIREHFVAATRRAEAAGFDMVELHCAHGYLLSSFLSPLTNRRSDEYGGSLENRLRYPLEVFEAMRAFWPSHKPMSVRISATDWADGGLSDEDAVAISRAFAEAGCDIVHVSTGQTTPDASPIFGRMWQTPFADRIRADAKVPVIAVGNISTADQINTIIASGRADLCALARPHLLDPHFTLRAAAAQNHAVPWPPQYEPGLSAAPKPVVG